MTKEQIIQELEDVSKYHRIQYKKIKNMFSGIESTKPTPVSKTECDLGKWLVNSEHVLTQLLGTQFYETLEEIHDEWHQRYYEFYTLYYVRTTGGFFSKSKSVFQVPEGADKEKAATLHETIEKTTALLLGHLDKCKKRLFALPQERFEELSY